MSKSRITNEAMHKATDNPMENSLQGKRILLGISGGIAAYKTPDLVRKLRALGADVQVVMTRGAIRFVTATSLQAVSGHPVRDNLWDPEAEAAMGHIELARWAEIILIAPATANCIAELTVGLANDLLTTLVLASSATLVLAPAMNQQMWRHPTTQRNLQQLREDGVQLIGPAEGDQACGETGPGRMLEPEEICSLLAGLDQTPRLRAHSLQAPPLPTHPLRGKKVIVTAGPTREPIDPVRFISNNSSGKQGFSLANAAQQAGADVCLIAGPVNLETPPGVNRIDVMTADEMCAAVLANIENCDLFFGVAAVSDYRPVSVHSRKIKKPESPSPGRSHDRSIELIQNPDIIAQVAALKDGPFTVGFAAETHDLIDYAKGKLKQKKLDAIVANDVADDRIGFDSEHNAATFIWSEGEIELEMTSKVELSKRIIAQAIELMQNRNQPETGRHTLA